MNLIIGMSESTWDSALNHILEDSDNIINNIIVVDLRDAYCQQNEQSLDETRASIASSIEG